MSSPYPIDQIGVVYEDTIYFFNEESFPFGDSDGDSLQSVIINTLPVNGLLLLNGAPVTVNQSIPAEMIPFLTWKPTLDTTSATTPSGDLVFDFTVVDDSGEAADPSQFKFIIGKFGNDFELSSLDGTNGFQVSGSGEYDHSGISVASAGDVNGDGFADFIIGALVAVGSGASYVVFGMNNGFDANFDLSGLDGSNGFQLAASFGDDFGRSVASAGDVNGDGFADILIGAPYSADYYGASYVVFGKAAGFDAQVDLSLLDGTDGFKLTGEAEYDLAGRSVAAAGDINGDGVGDFVIGAPYAGDGGASYVVFGKTTGFSASMALSTLNGSDGFKITGEAFKDRSGSSVASAGDVNGDGFNDLIIGSPQANIGDYGTGASYVIFGTDIGFGAEINLADLNPAGQPQLGFKIVGEGLSVYGTGVSVASAGDINGDGFSDVIIGAREIMPKGQYGEGASYVVFGTDQGFAVELNLAGLDGSNGFKINGEMASDYAGHSVASAGDFNGDGFDDLIIGAAGVDSSGYSDGASYLVFGKPGGFSAELDLFTLDGNNGFQINGSSSGDRSGSAVASAGDINGDGFDDLLIGAPGADGGDYSSGATYIVFGHAATVVEINAAPSGQDKTIFIDEDVPYEFSPDDFGLSDMDGDSLQAIVITTLPASGALTLNGIAVGANHTIAADSIWDLVWTPDENDNGDGLGSFTFQVIDDGGADGGGQNTDQTPNIIDFDVAAVNDAPDGMPQALAGGREDTPYTISLANLVAGFTDVENDALSVTGLAAANGMLEANANNTWTFTPDDNYNGKVDLTYTVSDGKGGEFAATGSFNLAPVNDAPTSPSAPQLPLAQGTEDTPYTIALAALLAGFSDIDNDSLTVINLTALNGGTLLENANNTWTFTPSENFNGTVNLSYDVSDGTTLVAVTDKQFSLLAVNDTPEGANKTVAVREQKAKTLSAADFGFSDADGNQLLSIKIDTLSSKGVLKLGTDEVTLGQTISAANLAELTYTSTGNGFGKAFDSFTFSVISDAVGGNDMDELPNTLTLNVSDVTDYFTGKSGKNRLVGTDGHDVINGKGGNDTLTGKGGSDIFIFKPGYDRDVIKDFDAVGADHDVLNIKSLNEIKNFKDLIHNHAEQVGKNVVIDGLHDNVIILQNVKLGQLHGYDFVF